MARLSTDSREFSSATALLDSSDDDVEKAAFASEKHIVVSKKPRLVICLQKLLLCMLYAFALVGIASTISSLIRTLRPPETCQVAYDQEYSPQYEKPPCYCGNSVTEAKSMGCVYDELSAGWLPSHCRDDELTAEFSSLGDNPSGGWMYWADKKPHAAFDARTSLDVCRRTT